MVIGTGPEREDMLEGPWEVVARVGIDGLEETEDDPDVLWDGRYGTEERKEPSVFYSCVQKR